MNFEVEIKGGAGEFEAAVIAVVLDHIAFEEKERKSRQASNDNRLSAWVRALDDPRGVPPAGSKRLS
jgi:hypothetical protein